MKINPLQLEQNLRASLVPLYLLCGDEPLLIEEARQTLLNHATACGFTAHEVIHVESAATFDWQEFMGLTYNIPFGNEKQIIELRLGEIKLKDSSAASKAKDKVDGSRSLIEYAAHPPKNKILIITSPKLDSAAQKTKWVSAINQSGVVIEIWPLVGQQVMGWIANKLRCAQLEVAREGIELIATLTAGNLLATKQEIEKLALLHGEAGNIKTLTMQQVISSITDNAKFNLFDLIDAIYAQNASKIAAILTHLQQEGAEPTFILWVLTRELRMLINLKDAAERSGSAALSRAMADRTYKIKSTNKVGVQRLLERMHTAQLMQGLQHAAVIDRIIKGVANIGESSGASNGDSQTTYSNDPWQELQRLALGLGSNSKI